MAPVLLPNADGEEASKRSRKIILGVKRSAVFFDLG
jgi:hypothetical protein